MAMKEQYTLDGGNSEFKLTRNKQAKKREMINKPKKGITFNIASDPEFTITVKYCTHQ